MEWYVARDGKTIGPMTFIDLVSAARSGQLGTNDLVWRAGMKDWTPAITVSGLWSPPPIPDTEGLQPPIVARTAEVSGQRQKTSFSQSRAAPAMPGKGIHVEKGLGVPAKIGLSVLVFVAGSLVAGIAKDPIMRSILGPFERMTAAILIQLGMVGLIFHIWTRPRKKSDEP